MTGLADGSASLATRFAQGFAGARCLVVGGAGGIGGAVVDQLVALDARVVSASRRGPAPQTLAQAPVAGAAMSIGVDITDPASIARLAAWVDARFGGLEVLVNTAGVTRQVPARRIEALDDETVDLVFAANAAGPLRVIRDLTPALRAGRDPCVVNVSSAAARTGLGSNIAYVGAKAAMDAMTVALAKALAPQIRLVSVAPSAVDTPFVPGRDARSLEATILATPLGRLASVTEVANAVLAAARLLTMTTGETIYVDGGRSL